MNQEADVVVIGSGSLGASTAFHLAKQGQRVVVVEKNALASQASPRAAGQAMQIWSDEALSQIAIQSIKKIEHFQEETGQPLPIHQTGSIKLARVEGDARQVHDEVARGRAMGVKVDLISRERAQELAPWLDPAGALAMWYAPDDLFMDPGLMPPGYLRAAQGLGAILLDHTTVVGIESRNGAVDSVMTDKGEIRAPNVVNCAGAWSRMIGAMAGVRIPVVPTRHQLYITKPIKGADENAQPTVRIVDAKVYVHAERGGLMFGGYEQDPLQIADMRELGPGFQIANIPLDMAPLRRLTDGVSQEFPALRDAEIDELRGCLPTMAPDARFIIDAAPSPKGFFVVTGCNVGGFSTSPAIGESVAALITGKTPPIDLSSFSLSRFGPELADEETLRRACWEAYALKYSEGHQ